MTFLRILFCLGVLILSAGTACAADSNDMPAPDGNDANAVIPRPDHNHPAFNERVEDRHQLVKIAIEGHGIKDPNVLRAMRTVPRHAFVRSVDQRQAYGDFPLPIGYEQTISQPYIVAYMTEKLQLDANAVVLEVGTGSGYQAAVAAEIARAVYTIEIVEPLATSAKKKLAKLGYHNVFVRYGDGYKGWPDKAPFDAIILTAAAEKIPKPLIEQLAIGGRLIMPLGKQDGLQHLALIVKQDDGSIKRRRLLPVRFVPMTGEVQKDSD